MENIETPRIEETAVPRKRKHTVGFVGRPPVNPKERLAVQVRTLATRNLLQFIRELQIELGLENTSDVLRLALWHFFKEKGKLTDEVAGDATFRELQDLGFLPQPNRLRSELGLEERKEDEPTD